MPLSLHLSIHLFFALLAGIIIWLFFRRHLLLALLGGFLGGFFIDLDHFFDYYVAFGFHFNLSYFSHGYQFLKNGRNFILFHGWEYVIILVILALFLNDKRWRVFILSLSLGVFFHLVADVNIDEGMTLKSYSILYRAKNGFLIEKIVTPEHYQEDVEKKKDPEIQKIIES